MKLVDAVWALAQTQVQAAQMQVEAMPPVGAPQPPGGRFSPNEREAKRVPRRAGSIRSSNLQLQRLEEQLCYDNELEVHPTERRIGVNPYKDCREEVHEGSWRCRDPR